MLVVFAIYEEGLVLEYLYRMDATV